MRDKTQSVDLSIIATFHREEDIALPTLRSIESCRRQASRAGIRTELVAVLDRSDERTRTLVQSKCSGWSDTRVLQVDFGDPGASRNRAIECVVGRFVAIADGDDLLTSNWLVSALKRLEDLGGNVIVHPELVVEFGSTRGVTRLPDMLREQVPLVSCVSTHFWISTCVAPTVAFREVPYASSLPESVFGYEDWHWNCEQIACGRVHVTAPESALLYRKKPHSQLRQQEREGRLVPHSRLFNYEALSVSSESDLAHGRASEISLVRLIRRAVLFMGGVRGKDRGGLTRTEVPNPVFRPPRWLTAELKELSSLEPELALLQPNSTEWFWWRPKPDLDVGYSYLAALAELRSWSNTRGWQVSVTTGSNAAADDTVEATSITAFRSPTESTATGVSIPPIGSGVCLQAGARQYVVTRLGLALRPSYIDLRGRAGLTDAQAAALKQVGIQVLRDGQAVMP